MQTEWREVHSPHPDFMTGRWQPPRVTVEPGNFAHGVWTALAATLAEPLRKAMVDHHSECVTCQQQGTAYCLEGRRLFDLLPDGDRVLIG